MGVQGKVFAAILHVAALWDGRVQTVQLARVEIAFMETV